MDRFLRLIALGAFLLAPDCMRASAQGLEGQVRRGPAPLLEAQKNLLKQYALLQFFERNCANLRIDTGEFERRILRSGGIDLQTNSEAASFLYGASIQRPPEYKDGLGRVCSDALKFFGPTGIVASGFASGAPGAVSGGSESVDCDLVKTTRIPFELHGETTMKSEKQPFFRQVYRFEHGYAAAYQGTGSALTKQLIRNRYLLESTILATGQTTRNEYPGSDVSKPRPDNGEYLMRSTQPSGAVSETRMTFKLEGKGVVSIGSCSFPTVRYSVKGLYSESGETFSTESEISPELEVAVRTHFRSVRKDGTIWEISTTVNSIRTDFVPLVASAASEKH
jgi:hypothetical protein